MDWVKPVSALRYAQHGLAYANEHEVHNLASYPAATIACLRLRVGEWGEAERLAQVEIDKCVTVSQLLARLALTELALPLRRIEPVRCSA